MVCNVLPFVKLVPLSEHTNPAFQSHMKFMDAFQMGYLNFCTICDLSRMSFNPCAL